MLKLMHNGFAGVSATTAMHRTISCLDSQLERKALPWCASCESNVCYSAPMHGRRDVRQKHCYHLL